MTFTNFGGYTEIKDYLGTRSFSAKAFSRVRRYPVMLNPYPSIISFLYICLLIGM